MKNPVRNSTALLLTMFLLGCGQSGPLYVSGNPSSVVQPVSDQTATEDEDKEEAAESDPQ
ncbi:MAG: lipoprotein [Gammaproteobacteria bacterium]|nr:lipoprotein [Gammaproteobacteria bacterium]MDH5303145.1 lipoprotein [Gammaproteobacteria bacterium]MDH5320847.1 lipoprotein [Gammaproteobacteria bacterium]